VDDDAEDVGATPVVAPVEADDSEVPEVKPAKSAPKASAPKASASRSAEVEARVDVSEVDAKDEVLITMFETIEPAPRIGTYNIPALHGINKLVARKNYRFPKFVAEVLVDAKKAEYLQVS
jgi:hypothetical protein